MPGFFKTHELRQRKKLKREPERFGGVNHDFWRFRPYSGMLPGFWRPEWSGSGCMPRRNPSCFVRSVGLDEVSEHNHTRPADRIGAGERPPAGAVYTGSAGRRSPSFCRPPGRGGNGPGGSAGHRESGGHRSVFSRNRKRRRNPRISGGGVRGRTENAGLRFPCFFLYPS